MEISPVSIVCGLIKLLTGLNLDLALVVFTALALVVRLTLVVLASLSLVMGLALGQLILLIVDLLVNIVLIGLVLALVVLAAFALVVASLNLNLTLVVLATLALVMTGFDLNNGLGLTAVVLAALTLVMGLTSVKVRPVRVIGSLVKLFTLVVLLSLALVVGFRVTSLHGSYESRGTDGAASLSTVSHNSPNVSILQHTTTRASTALSAATLLSLTT